MIFRAACLIVAVAASYGAAYFAEQPANWYNFVSAMWCFAAICASSTGVLFGKPN